MRECERKRVIKVEVTKQAPLGALNALFTFSTHYYMCIVCARCARRNLTHGAAAERAHNCKRKSRNKQEKYPTDNYPKWLFIKSCRNPQPAARKETINAQNHNDSVRCIPRMYSCSPFFCSLHLSLRFALTRTAESLSHQLHPAASRRFSRKPGGTGKVSKGGGLHQQTPQQYVWLWSKRSPTHIITQKCFTADGADNYFLSDLQNWSIFKVKGKLSLFLKCQKLIL